MCVLDVVAHGKVVFGYKSLCMYVDGGEVYLGVIMILVVVSMGG